MLGSGVALGCAARWELQVWACNHTANRSRKMTGIRTEASIIRKSNLVTRSQFFLIENKESLRKPHTPTFQVSGTPTISGREMSLGVIGYTSPTKAPRALEQIPDAMATLMMKTRNLQCI